MRFDNVRDRHVLLSPEGALALNVTAAAVLELCDGGRTLDEIVDTLSQRYAGADVRSDVEKLLSSVADRGLVVDVDA